MDVVSFAAGVWFGACIAVTLLIVMGILSLGDDDDTAH